MQKEINIQGEVFLLCDDKSNLQLSVIHDYLTTSYWSEGISSELIDRAIANSLCFGLYLNAQENGQEISRQQIGFARVTTDKASFAYLADVFILPAYENLGLGSALVSFVMQHNDLQGLRRFMLCTRDAHGLYKKFGFTEVDNPKMMMQISKQGLYLPT
ncbi:GNAT family N-acetyltransferase [Colwellia sp. 12G3]|uniref:GNAT family N-acetyltransferase n=1 Tax=Colwellia sp. 12G3 TaxID=2058299 RepID=UPI000C32F7DA|nr:GNAT family N-acetyltransferase [Colwellia sp. 12G3]PKI14903.1 GNAT family N-acetyltransferase [Colwellia sp. 12G3]